MGLPRRVGILVAVTLTVAGLAGCHGSQRRYDEATQEAFMAVCRQGKNAPSEQVCGCYYDQLTSEMPYDRFSRLDRSMKDNPNFTPDEVINAVSACSNGGVVSTSPPPSPKATRTDDGASDRGDTPDRSSQPSRSDATGGAGSTDASAGTGSSSNGSIDTS